ncbi:hypothetical protein ACS127_16240 [Amphibacillus sp. Q70]|uniref:hypothetical protein n=1 Tax=Amphibacillus sp. Q70 TaxID=3453416 RepID=UPI003F850BCD
MIQIDKKLMLNLAVLALVSPLMKITGWIHVFGNEAVGSIAMTALVSIVWIVIIVKKDVAHPVQTSIGQEHVMQLLQ